MKSLLKGLTACTLILLLSACSDDDNPSPQTPPPTIEDPQVSTKNTTTTTEEDDDKKQETSKQKEGEKSDSQDVAESTPSDSTPPTTVLTPSAEPASPEDSEDSQQANNEEQTESTESNPEQTTQEGENPPAPVIVQEDSQPEQSTESDTDVTSEQAAEPTEQAEGSEDTTPAESEAEESATQEESAEASEAVSEPVQLVNTEAGNELQSLLAKIALDDDNGDAKANAAFEPSFSLQQSTLGEFYFHPNEIIYSTNDLKDIIVERIKNSFEKSVYPGLQEYLAQNGYTPLGYDVELDIEDEESKWDSINSQVTESASQSREKLQTLLSEGEFTNYPELQEVVPAESAITGRLNTLSGVATVVVDLDGVTTGKVYIQGIKVNLSKSDHLVIAKLNNDQELGGLFENINIEMEPKNLIVERTFLLDRNDLRGYEVPQDFTIEPFQHLSLYLPEDRNLDPTQDGGVTANVEAYKPSMSDFEDARETVLEKAVEKLNEQPDRLQAVDREIDGLIASFGDAYAAYVEDLDSAADETVAKAEQTAEQSRNELKQKLESGKQAIASAAQDATLKLDEIREKLRTEYSEKSSSIQSNIDEAKKKLEELKGEAEETQTHLTVNEDDYQTIQNELEEKLAVVDQKAKELLGRQQELTQTVSERTEKQLHDIDQWLTTFKENAEKLVSNVREKGITSNSMVPGLSQN